MLQALPNRAARSLSSLPSLARRTLATHVPAPSASDVPATASASSSASPDGPLRPHLGVEVNPNHGLYAFFRKQEKDGRVSYETVEPVDLVADKSGRAWTAPELRRKSFKDLHTLWYVVLRERNLLATQQAEARRIGANEQALSLWAKAFRCRKTMARIKYVINERRVAYEGAVKIFNEEREQVLKQEDAVRATAEAETARQERQREKENRRERGSADVAADSLGLFEPVQEKA
ncbi:mitochondrial 39-S ribosomal protein L47 (MRP-L47)-domain-containing protein [Trametes elegans]|nr:mitochondrial 39-S ribosomal protein L47 (MRP-L47)-domain-containing protein [Trametes elegans]